MESRAASILKRIVQSHYFRLIPALAAACIALCFCLRFPLQVFGWKRELSRQKELLETEIPLSDQTNPEGVSRAPQQNRNSDKSSASLPSIGVRPPQDAGSKTYSWSPDDTLMEEALHRFSKAGKWEAALFLSTRLNPEHFTQDQLDLVSGYSGKVFGDAFRKETERWKKETSSPSFDFDRLSLPDAAAFLENIRLELLNGRISGEIVSILMRAFLNSPSDTFLRHFALAQLQENPPALPVAYGGKESEEFFLQRFRNDPFFPREYMNSRFELILNALARAPEDGPDKKWILSLPAGKEQARTLRKVIRSGDRDLELKEYLSLPVSMRRLIALRTFSGPSAMSRDLLGKSFRSHVQGLEWIQALRANARTDGFLLSAFRSLPGVLKALHKLDYAEAEECFLRSWNLIFGEEPSAEIREMFSRPLEMEKKLWKELVHEKLWKHSSMLLQEAEGKVSENAAFYHAVTSSFPVSSVKKESLENRRRLLLALVMLNRGEDPRYIHLNVQMKQKDLIRELDLKELKENE